MTVDQSRRGPARGQTRAPLPSVSSEETRRRGAALSVRPRRGARAVMAGTLCPNARGLSSEPIPRRGGRDLEISVCRSEACLGGAPPATLEIEIGVEIDRDFLVSHNPPACAEEGGVGEVRGEREGREVEEISFRRGTRGYSR